MKYSQSLSASRFKLRELMISSSNYAAWERQLGRAPSCGRQHLDPLGTKTHFSGNATYQELSLTKPFMACVHLSRAGVTASTDLAGALR